MDSKERLFIAAVLLGVLLLAGVDLATDSREGAAWWHLFAEGLVGLAAAGGIFLLIRDTIGLKRSLAIERQTSGLWRQEAGKWRERSKKYIDGLSLAIEDQLTAWNLTNAEKEVAFLLLKGFSLKEISDLRNTSEKTVRAQSTTVYAKAGVGGRSELAAFFLEDLFLPTGLSALPDSK